MSNLEQLDLFGAIQKVYGEDGQVSNERLYQRLSEVTGVDPSVWSQKAPVGKSGQEHSMARRKVRWFQQTLKKLGLIEKVDGKRGVWRAAMGCKKDLTPAPEETFLVAFSTKLGLAIWGRCESVFPAIDEPIHLMISSPPYPLRNPRAYGNPTVAQYIDFICESLEPIVKNLVEGGSICLNVSNDIFEQGRPARSMYQERLLIALNDRLGLSKMDQFIWHNPTKAPGPIQWASKKRYQLNVSYEPIYWLTNCPEKVRSDNRRVLQPHSEAQLKLIASGGEKRNGVYGDGANRIKEGSFSNATGGKIPRNLFTVAHRCAKQGPAKKALKDAGLAAHSACMPFTVADFLVKFMTEPGDLVVDPFGGLFTTAHAAQANGRRWISTEMNHEYAWAGAHRFSNEEGFDIALSV